MTYVFQQNRKATVPFAGNDGAEAGIYETFEAKQLKVGDSSVGIQIRDLFYLLTNTFFNLGAG